MASIEPVQKVQKVEKVGGFDENQKVDEFKDEKAASPSSSSSTSSNATSTSSSTSASSSKSKLKVKTDSKTRAKQLFFPSWAPNETTYNVCNWIQENEKNFVPPVCNKLMFANQLKVIVVGAPNTRCDYHIECGEELLYQLKGNMHLPIVEKGKHRDICIPEGYMFLLPARMPHSPQRPEKGSIGLVFERHRHENELDGLRWYCPKKMDQELHHIDEKPNKILTDDVFFERWFHCNDLGLDLEPIIKEFNNSKAMKEGKPTSDSTIREAPYSLSNEKIEEPFNLKEFILKNKDKLQKNKCLDVICGKETCVKILTGKHECCDTPLVDMWVYVLEGSAKITFHERKLKHKSTHKDKDKDTVGHLEKQNVGKDKDTGGHLEKQNIGKDKDTVGNLEKQNVGKDKETFEHVEKHSTVKDVENPKDTEFPKITEIHNDTYKTSEGKQKDETFLGGKQKDETSLGGKQKDETCYGEKFKDKSSYGDKRKDKSCCNDYTQPLNKNDCLIVNYNQRYTLCIEDEMSQIMTVRMKPAFAYCSSCDSSTKT